MSTQKFTVTHADGTVSKRTSKTRTYTYAVEYGPANPEVAAAYERESAEALKRKIATIAAAIESPTFTTRGRGGWIERNAKPENRHSHETTLVGTKISTWTNAEGESTDGFPSVNLTAEETRAKLLASALRSIEYIAEDVRRAEKRAEEYLSGERGTDYGVVRWSASFANASKAANGSEFDYLRHREGRSVHVVAVDD